MRASLPMYDLPELRPATDAWWAGLRAALAVGGITAPAALDRTTPSDRVWRDPDLVLSQCCGFDLVFHAAGRLTPVAVPTYAAEGCEAGTYRSALIVRAADSRHRLAAFAGATAAINGLGSHSGWVALRHALAGAGAADGFFGRGVLTGSHRRSMEAVRDGDADLAAIDAVTFALVRLAAPSLGQSLRVLAWSEPAPALPYVTAAGRAPGELARLTAALVAATAEPALRDTCRSLLIERLEPTTSAAYERIRLMHAAGPPRPCRELWPLAAGQRRSARPACLEPSHQPVDLGPGLGGEAWGRRAQGRAGQGTAAP